jgi:hypothetical protein
MDLNSDGRARDSFYGGSVSQPLAGTSGITGLSTTTTSAGGITVYEAPSDVMVWSPGPDGMISTAVSSAATGANKDNIISWKQ